MPPFVQISEIIPKLKRICEISSKISPPFKKQSCWNSYAKNQPTQTPKKSDKFPEKKKDAIEPMFDDDNDSIIDASPEREAHF